MKARAAQRASVSGAAHVDSAPPSASQRRRESIVVGLDGRAHDADALALARTLRDAFDGAIVLVHATAEAPLGWGILEFKAVELRDGQQLLTRAAATMAEPVDVELISGWPASLALERIARRSHATLMVLGSSHQPTLGRIVPGSVALRLLKRAPCPVAVAPVGYAEAARRAITGVGVAYDATSGAIRALHAAATAAGRLGVPLHVYHAVPYAPDEAARAQMLSFARVILDRAREQLPSWVNPRVRALVGDPAAAIAQAVGDDDVGVLFVGSRGHGPLRDGIFGGVCRALLQSAPCPVVLIPHDASTLD